LFLKLQSAFWQFQTTQQFPKYFFSYQHFNFNGFHFITVIVVYAFSALTLLFGYQEGHHTFDKIVSACFI